MLSDVTSKHYKNVKKKMKIRAEGRAAKALNF